MKITDRGDYALKAVLDLSRRYGELVTINDMARRIDAPVKFLEQVLLELKKGGFVKSKRGKVGGYLLARMPEAISVGDVIRFIDGPIGPIACVEKDYSECRDVYNCVFRSIWQKVNRATLEIVDNVNFGDLVSRAELARPVFSYVI